MHNFYSYLYNQTVFELLRSHRGEQEAVVFARSATAGGQRFPVHWGGDCESTFVSMAESLRGGLSLAMSGFGFWSHDIGGFEGRPDPAVFKRWIPFGLLCTHSRLHGSDSYRVPWLFDDESVEVLRIFTRLKMRLMPYLYGQAVAASQDGMPVLRPMAAEFPDDPACSHLDRQYMLGDRLSGGAGVHGVRGDLVLPPGRGVDPPANRRHRNAAPAGSARCATSARSPSTSAPDRSCRWARGTTGPTTRTTRTSRCGRISSPPARG